MGNERKRLAEQLGSRILDGTCTVNHQSSGKCIGVLRLFFYPWCNQYRLACNHCGTVVRIHGLNMDPMQHEIAQGVAEYVETITCTPDDALWQIRKRFRQIDYYARHAQGSLFT